MDTTIALKNAFATARELSLAQNLNYISLDMICYTAIQQDNAFMPFSKADIDWLSEELLGAILNDGVSNLKPPADSLPLTMDAEILIRFTEQYAHLFEDYAIDTTHLILAILSCDFLLSRLLKQRGWVFKNYLCEFNAFGKVEPESDEPLRPPTGMIPRRRTIKLIDRLFNRESRQLLALQYINDALRLLDFKDYERALLAVDLSTRHAPQTLEYLYRRAYIFYRCRQWQTANEVIDSAMQLKFAKTLSQHRSGADDLDKFRFMKSICFGKLGQYGDSISILNDLLITSPSSAGYYNNIGFDLQCTREFDQSIPYFNKALKLRPDMAFCLNNKGYSLFNTGKIDEGIALVHRSLEIDKGNSYAYRNLAIIAKAVGNIALAAEMQSKAFLFGYQADFGNDIDDLLTNSY